MAASMDVLMVAPMVVVSVVLMVVYWAYHLAPSTAGLMVASRVENSVAH